MKRCFGLLVIVVCVIAVPLVALSEVTDAEVAAQQAAGTEKAMLSASAKLEQMSTSEKANAQLYLEDLNAPAKAVRSQALEAEDLWARGQYAQAIEAVRQLEASGAIFAPTIAWKEPIVSQGDKYYADVRIGNTRQDAEDVALDFHRGTGNMFAVVSWDGVSDSTWTVNISTDRGATWSETYSYSFPGLIDMVVVDDYVYVSYVWSDLPSAVRMRRFLASDGSVDTSYPGTSPYYHTVVDVSPATVVDISAGGNPDFTNDRIYCSFIDSDHNLEFYWDTSSDGTTFSSLPTGVTNADTGLDYHFNTWNSSGYWAFLSYIGTDDSVNVARYKSSGGWDIKVVDSTYTGSSVNRRARISAYEDNIFVAFEEQSTEGRGIKYNVSYNGGDSWSYGFAYEPASGEPGGNGGDISVRSGQKSIAVFNREDGTPDKAYVVERAGLASGLWTDPLWFANQDAYSGGPCYLQFMGVLGVQSYGMVYFADDKIPYFDLSAVRAFFFDGFESGGWGGWDAAMP